MCIGPTPTVHVTMDVYVYVSMYMYMYVCRCVWVIYIYIYKKCTTFLDLVTENISFQNYSEFKVCANPHPHQAAPQRPANTKLRPSNTHPCPNACCALCLGQSCGGSPQEGQTPHKQQGKPF
jgi:hypothetical protein